MNRRCKICKNKLVGRSDKIFCSVKCKSYYHFRLAQVTKVASREIDGYLHRNRSILLEVMGKNKSQIKIKKIVLQRKRFKFNFHTHITVNKRGKTYHHVYDFAWMAFSDDEVLIVRKRNK